MNRDNNEFGDILEYMGHLHCHYVVKADGCIMLRTDSLPDALRAFKAWTVQLSAALPSMGDKVTIEVLL